MLAYISNKDTHAYTYTCTYTYTHMHIYNYTLTLPCILHHEIMPDFANTSLYFIIVCDFYSFSYVFGYIKLYFHSSIYIMVIYL